LGVDPALLSGGWRVVGDFGCSVIEDTARKLLPRYLVPEETLPSRDPASDPIEDCELGRRPSAGRRLEAGDEATNFFVTVAGFFVAAFGGEARRG
jgi:hypothetical protein